MGFNGLPTEQAAEVLRAASVVVSERGHSKGAVRDPSDGSVSVVGSIAVASGAKWERLSDDEEVLMSLVPRTNLPAAMLAWECAEAMSDDLYAWEDSPSTTKDDVVAFLVRCSDRMAIVTRK